MTKTTASSSVSQKSRRIRNSLWIFRKRMNYAQKEAAFLLGHRNTAQLSRYEKSRRIPSLKTALKLEIIYAAPMRLLFSELYNEIREEIRKKKESLFKTTKG